MAPRRPGVEYFGPYAHAYAIRSTLDLLLRTFPIRTCTDALFKRQQAQGRPCLLYHIEKCTGPCIDAVEPEEYQKLVDGLAAFLRGDTDAVVGELRQKMYAASERQEYELAARLRDRLRDVERANERQEVVTDKREDFDLLATFGDDLETSVQVLHVRRGRLVGRLGTIVDRVEDVTEPELVGSLIREVYGDQEPPREVLVQYLPDELEVWEAWLTERRGGRVTLRVPQRGAKRRLMETAIVNAREAFARHRLRRQADHNARAKALRSLQETLDLPEAPLRIEAYDISTLQGTNTVASMVVLEDGLPETVRVPALQDQDRRRSGRLRGHGGGHQAPVHRLPAGKAEDHRRADQVLLSAVAGPDRRRSRPAGTGGQGAGRARPRDPGGRSGQADGGGVSARANRSRSGFPGTRRRCICSSRSATRPTASPSPTTATFARRGWSIRCWMRCPGIGPTRKRVLLKRFGSLKQIREAGPDELAELLPEATARELYAALHRG